MERLLTYIFFVYARHSQKVRSNARKMAYLCNLYRVRVPLLRPSAIRRKNFLTLFTGYHCIASSFVVYCQWAARPGVFASTARPAPGNEGGLLQFPGKSCIMGIGTGSARHICILLLVFCPYRRGKRHAFGREDLFHKLLCFFIFVTDLQKKKKAVRAGRLFSMPSALRRGLFYLLTIQAAASFPSTSPLQTIASPSQGTMSG